MRRRRIGIDCDGVLGEFTAAFILEAQRLFPEANIPFGRSSSQPGYEIEYWPGFTKEIVKATWAHIQKARDWWLTLAPIPSFQERKALLHLARDHDVYIITARHETQGDSVPFQTYKWLGNQGIHGAGVIVSHKKGPLARVLELDYFLDDKPANCVDVVDCGKSEQANVVPCKVYLRAWPWTTCFRHWQVDRVASLGEFIDFVRKGEGT